MDLQLFGGVKCEQSTAGRRLQGSALRREAESRLAFERRVRCLWVVVVVALRRSVKRSDRRCAGQIRSRSVRPKLQGGIPRAVIAHLVRNSAALAAPSGAAGWQCWGGNAGDLAGPPCVRPSERSTWRRAFDPYLGCREASPRRGPQRGHTGSPRRPPTSPCHRETNPGSCLAIAVAVRIDRRCLRHAAGSPPPQTGRASSDSCAKMCNYRWLPQVMVATLPLATVDQAYHVSRLERVYF
jgi:hypothetical protein